MIEAGKHFNTEKALQTFTKTLDTMVLRDGDTILIQNSFGEHAVLPSLESLRRVHSNVTSYTREKMGFCIHLGYLFSAGQYDFREQEAIEAFFDYMDRLSCVHADILTDTSSQYHSDTCEYTPIGEGEMWKSLSMVEQILRGCKQRGIHVIVQSVSDLYVVRDLYRKINDIEPYYIDINDTYWE